MALSEKLQRKLLGITRVIAYGGIASMIIVVLLGIWSLIRLTVALEAGSDAEGLFSFGFVYPDFIVNTVFAIETMMYVGVIGIIILAVFGSTPKEKRRFRFFLIPYLAFLFTYGLYLFR